MWLRFKTLALAPVQKQTLRGEIVDFDPTPLHLAVLHGLRPYLKAHRRHLCQGNVVSACRLSFVEHCPSLGHYKGVFLPSRRILSLYTNLVDHTKHVLPPPSFPDRHHHFKNSNQPCVVFDTPDIFASSLSLRQMTAAQKETNLPQHVVSMKTSLSNCTLPLQQIQNHHETLDQNVQEQSKKKKKKKRKSKKTHISTMDNPATNHPNPQCAPEHTLAMPMNVMITTTNQNTISSVLMIWYALKLRQRRNLATCEVRTW